MIYNNLFIEKIFYFLPFAFIYIMLIKFHAFLKENLEYKIGIAFEIYLKKRYLDFYEKIFIYDNGAIIYEDNIKDCFFPLWSKRKRDLYIRQRYNLP